MSRYIDADVALNNLDSNKYGIELNQEEVQDRFEEVYSYLDNQPTADVVPVIHAHWIVIGKTRGYHNRWKCSYCGAEQSSKKSNYCRDCGAKMDERVKE